MLQYGGNESVNESEACHVLININNGENDKQRTKLRAKRKYCSSEPHRLIDLQKQKTNNNDSCTERTKIFCIAYSHIFLNIP